MARLQAHCSQMSGDACAYVAVLMCCIAACCGPLSLSQSQLACEARHARLFLARWWTFRKQLLATPSPQHAGCFWDCGRRLARRRCRWRVRCNLRAA